MGLELVNDGLITRYIRVRIAIMANLLNGIFMSSNVFLHPGSCKIRCYFIKGREKREMENRKKKP
jgi:hypothetical protein